MARKKRCCKFCAESDSDDAGSDASDDSSASSGSDMPSEVGEVVQTDWWQEREFDSMFFAPGMFVSGSPRDMSASLSTPKAAAMTQSLKVIATALPDPAPLDKAPVSRLEIPGLTVDRIRTRLEAEPFLWERVFREDVKASDITPSMWQEGTRIPGTKIRGCKFKMPIPADVPGFIKKMVSIPELADVRALFRMRCGTDRVDVVEQTIALGVPMGDAFRVQVTHSFVPGAQGVVYSKWVDVVWLKSLMGLIKSYITQTSESSARNGAEVLKQALLAECSA